MATRITLKVDRDGQVGEVPLHDVKGNEAITAATLGTLVEAAWDQRATEEERGINDPGDDAALDLEKLGRVAEAAFWLSFRQYTKKHTPPPEM